MIINLELYRAFITVAEQGSFTRAAGELGLTQSAVSQAVRQLEDLLGAQLFVRTGRGILLTDAGETLMEYVGGLLTGVSNAQNYFKQLGSLETGSLRIGASDTLSRHVLLPYLSTFHARYPGVSIQVTNRTSDETVALLRQGRVDVGFVNLPVAGSGDFRIRQLTTVQDCFVCGPKYHEHFMQPVTLARVMEFPLLMLERISASRRYVEDFLAGHGLKPQPQIELGSFDLMVDFARAGLGIAVVVQEFVAPDHNLRIIETTESIPPRSIAMIQRKNSAPTFAVQAFSDLLLAAR